MKNLGRLRRRARLSQEQLAAAIGVNRGALSMWECGKSWPPANILPSLANVLGCTIEELYLEPNAEEGESPCISAT